MCGSGVANVNVTYQCRQLVGLLHVAVQVDAATETDGGGRRRQSQGLQVYLWQTGFDGSFHMVASQLCIDVNVAVQALVGASGIDEGVPLGDGSLTLKAVQLP